jgi:ATP-dependent Clp protease protease subunit
MKEAMKEYDALLKNRTISITGMIQDSMAGLITRQLLFLEAENPNREVVININSPGGQVAAGLAIYDAMQFIRCPISTVCIGQAAGMASLLLCAGTPGLRRSFPNSLISIVPAHQDPGREVTKEDVAKVKRRIRRIYAKHTNQLFVFLSSRHMTAEQAKAFGVIDEVTRRIALE